MLLAHMTTFLLYSDRGRLSGAHDESENPGGVPSRQAAGLKIIFSLKMNNGVYDCSCMCICVCVRARLHEEA
jgi:hypothetical protein